MPTQLLAIKLGGKSAAAPFILINTLARQCALG
jgi:hypothetical protein